MSSSWWPRLMLVLDPQASPLPPEVVGEAAARGGVDAVQVRGCATDRDAFLLASRLVAALANTQVRVLVNERFDIAVAAAAHGVHLKDRGLSAREVREAARRVGARSDFLVAVAAHDAAGLRAAAVTGADWCTVSPFRDAHGRAGHGEEGMRALLEEARAAGPGCPWVLLGGVREGDEAVAARLGSRDRWGLAAVRALHDAPSAEAVESRARRWRDAIDAAAAAAPSW